MAVDREEINASERAMFQLASSQNTLPRLSTESDLVTWAERIIKGETERQAAGLIPITLPPLESLQEKYDNYRAARSNRDHAQDNSSKEAADVQAMREEVESFIRDDLWYEILGAFRKEDPATQRRKARQWGVRYRFQQSETPLADEPVDSEGNDIDNDE